jgi:dihydrofolate reductase
MGKIIVFTNLTLDGVMQSPAQPEEDTRNGFKYGGWATPFGAMQEGGEALANVGAVLFGRWTYENFYHRWAKAGDNPFTTFFNNIQKYVASTTLEPVLIWENSTLIEGDTVKAIEKLKTEQEKDFVVFGSGVLTKTLMQNNLVDYYVLFIHPLVLGEGQRLFTDDVGHLALRLVSNKITTTGVLIVTFEPTDSNGSAV